jgi:hypothetical protein
VDLWGLPVIACDFCHRLFPLLGYQFPPHVVCIRFSQPGGCISDSRSNVPVRSHQRTRAANSFTSASVLPTAVNPR